MSADDRRKKLVQNNRTAQPQQSEKKDYRVEPCLESFICANCGREVHPENAGSKHRNHCPYCLCSLHLDITPGDRAADCGGIMDPLSVWAKTGKKPDDGEWVIIHRCRKCGALSSNRSLADDDPVKLMNIVLDPLAKTPFPMDRLRAFAESFGYDADAVEDKPQLDLGTFNAMCEDIGYAKPPEEEDEDGEDEEYEEEDE